MAVIQACEGTRLYAGTWNVERTVMQLPESLEAEVICNVCSQVEDKYGMHLYAVVLEDQMMELKVEKDPNIWYFIDQKALIKFAAEKVEKKNLTACLNDLTHECQMKSVGELPKRYTFSSRGSVYAWQERHKLVSYYLQDVAAVKLLAGAGKIELNKDIANRIFDVEFEQDVQQELDLLTSLKNLEDKCENKQTTLADTVEA
ncbi:uncharacterized protein LOC135167981 [Diachasmimorpha longicaudata]|uniref:uncharacterized protein LOC135167981 n=1 Tax=Diachasmimorpha longicaudata TaxID=58733 RepID=UPI0030B8EB2D